MPHTLSAASDPLASTYDVALLDLDGVVYVGPDAVPAAPQALEAARGVGMRLAFVTNNAARTPAVVAEHLTALGIPAKPAEVITSSQAAAHYLSDRLPAGAAVLVVGTSGLTEALTERGLIPVFSADDDPEAVVQGYSPDLDWRQLAEGSIAVRNGKLWVATNLDPTVPSPRGPLPGNGSLVAALRHATGATPVATGKPDPTMHRESVQRSNAKRPIVVGDRLDTDIEGATAVGCPSLLVYSGVTSYAEPLTAPPNQRPDFLAHDVSGLLHRHVAPTLDGATATCGEWQVSVRGAELRLAHIGANRNADGSDGPAGDDPATHGQSAAASTGSADDLDPLRALYAAAWHAADAAEEPSASWTFAAADETSAAALKALALG